jgi:hypothetical protein
VKIKTEHVYPPIPDRSFDWSAIDDDTYDGPGSPVGRGATEAEAIADLLSKKDEQLEERTAEVIDGINADVDEVLGPYEPDPPKCGHREVFKLPYDSSSKTVTLTCILAEDDPHDEGHLYEAI